MAKFKEGKQVLKYISKHPTLPISATALGISMANLSTNAERRKDAEKQSKDTIKAMNKLTDSMSKVSASFDEAEKRGAVIVKEKEQPKKKKRFRIGYYSDVVGDTLRGASLGTGFGVFTNGIATAAALSEKKGWSVKKALTTVGLGLLVGASLGLLFGITKKIAETVSRNKTNQRILTTVSKLLQRRGLKEDKDFILDPKIADQEKTKVAILVNHGNGDLKLALNVVSDPKLEKVCSNITSNLPDKSKKTVKESNRYNEIMITSMSSGNDALIIADITEKFVRAGYPVYMIEVG